MIKYSLKKSGSLYHTKAAVIGDNAVLSFDLLVDTGSTFTIIPVESLKILGYDIASSKERVRLITGSGYIYAPKINVQWIQSLGCKFDSFSVVVHTLPPEMYFKGILGMDFLKKAKAIINTFKGEIEVQV